MNYFLKLIGTVAEPWNKPYDRQHVDFARYPRSIQEGDHLILYAVAAATRQ